MAIVASLVSGWVVLVLLAPWLPVPVAGAVYLFGSDICHQIGDRSWFVGGVQLPVCARCLGIYAGAAAGLVSGLHRPNGSRVMSCALALNAATLAIEWIGLWQVSNGARTAAGAMLGVALALAIRQAFGCPQAEAGTVDYARCPSPRRTRAALPESPI